MKLVTWNVNSLKQRLPRVLELLAEHQPDVVCLQETKTTPEAFPHDELAEAGYAAAHHSGGRWAGVAVLGRTQAPPRDVTAGLPGEVEQDECRWVEATVAGVRVASVYVPNGRSLDSPAFPAKLVFLEAMRERVGQLTPPLVVAGDVNVAPADIDVYDPAGFVGSTHTSEGERNRLQQILDAGLVDAYRHLHPDEQHFTWWDYRAGHFHKGLGLRIDLIMASKDLADRLTHCGIDRSYRKGPKPSDHAPLLATFD
ncbi:MAG TPA: exodeoxyribonuclease III [Egibacteraceae bacterium]|nr:exodeoxyribonuclease III [Egibacteraceae bacterium]